MARLITAVVAMLLLAVLVLTPASEASSGPVLAAPGAVSGDYPHDCHLEPLHGTHYVAGQVSNQPRPTDKPGVVSFRDSLAWISQAEPIGRAVVWRLSVGGRDQRASCSPSSLQVFRL